MAILFVFLNDPGKSWAINRNLIMNNKIIAHIRQNVDCVCVCVTVMLIQQSTMERCAPDHRTKTVVSPTVPLRERREQCSTVNVELIPIILSMFVQIAL